jgi:hypothetical protein
MKRLVRVGSGGSKQGGKGFWSSQRIVLFFLLSLALIFGMLVQHYYLGPLLSGGCVEELRICKSQVQVLDEENKACYQQNYDLNRLLTPCIRDLQRWEESG